MVGVSKKDGSKKYIYIYAGEREKPEWVGVRHPRVKQTFKKIFFLFRKKHNDPGNFFASSFLHKEKIPLTHRRSSKYDDDREI